MSIVGKVVAYTNDSFYLVDTRIKLTKQQAQGYTPIGIPRGKEPSDLVGEYVKFYIKKRTYKFTNISDSVNIFLVVRFESIKQPSI